MKEPRRGRTQARKRSVTKLLPSCYQGVTLRLHNWGVKRPGAPLLSFPFPSVTPGAPGFLTLRQGKKAGGLQDPSPISPLPPRRSLGWGRARRDAPDVFEWHHAPCVCDPWGQADLEGGDQCVRKRPRRSLTGSRGRLAKATWTFWTSSWL